MVQKLKSCTQNTQSTTRAKALVALGLSPPMDINNIKRNKMLWKIRNKYLESYFREDNVRIPILAKPLLQNPIIAIISCGHGLPVRRQAPPGDVVASCPRRGVTVACARGHPRGRYGHQGTAAHGHERRLCCSASRRGSKEDAEKRGKIQTGKAHGNSKIIKTVPYNFIPGENVSFHVKVLCVVICAVKFFH